MDKPSKHEKLQRLIFELLDNTQDEASADQICQQLQQLWQTESSFDLKPETILETEGDSGLVISPTTAGMCSQGYRRVRRYLIALYQAIQDRLKQNPDQPVRILYPGCGPFAPLALPLMALFSPQQVQLHLLDFHAISIASVKHLTAQFQLMDFVCEYHIGDAMTYHIQPDLQPDIILSEILLAGLAREGHVAINHHLINQAPQAMLIPEQIQLRLQLLKPEIEFATLISQRPEHRTDLGEVFTFCREVLLDYPEQGCHYLPGESVVLPINIDSEYHTFLFTEIKLYGQEYLREYEDGLTTPIVYPLQKGYKSGNTLAFDYQMGCSPGLVQSQKPDDR